MSTLTKSRSILRSALPYLQENTSKPWCTKATTTKHFSSREQEISQEDSLIAEVLTPYKVHNFESPSIKVKTSKEEAFKMFTDMYLMRRVEIAADNLYKQGLIRGFCHLYDGQEGIAVGMEAGLSKDDAILTAYRDHCTYIGRGGTPFEVFCELLGKMPGAAHGKGGSMHLYKKNKNFFGGWGIVGTSGPLGTGLALGLKLENKKSVAVSIFGDGAANQGQVYEAYNMAAIWQLPVIYVVENNHFGMGTSVERASAQPTFFDRVEYIPGLWVDGMDAFAVKQAILSAKEHALENGPIILEMDTYRYHGHSMSDPGSTYRHRNDIQQMRKSRDCIERFKSFLVEKSVKLEEELRQVEKQIKVKVEEDTKKALNAPHPPDSELLKEVYAGDESKSQQKSQPQSVMEKFAGYQ